MRNRTNTMELPASLIGALAFTVLAAFPLTAVQANEVLWSQPNNSYQAAPESTVTTDPPSSTEVADDFEIIGQVQRVVISGNDCFQCAAPTVAGVYVRFYEWTESGPAALQVETFIDGAGDGFLYDVSGPATLDITLPKPFLANGKHFISVQLAIDGFGFWGWWTANDGNPNGQAMYHRTDGGAWQHYTTPLHQPFYNGDVSFLIWGDDGTPPPPGTDPCGEWSTPVTPVPNGTEHSVLRDVAAISSAEAYAVGHYSASVVGSLNTFGLAMHWVDDKWILLDPPQPTAYVGGTWVDFQSVAVQSPTDIWAAGGKRVQAPDGYVGTQIYIARFDGSNWTMMNSPLTSGGSGAHVQDIEIISENDIWFFGDWIGSIPGGTYPPTGTFPALAMHWDGSNFTVTPTPFPTGGTPGWGLEAGSALSPDDIWAVGGGSDGDDAFKSYIIHWNGSQWDHVPGPTPGTFQRLYDVKALAPDDVWATGSYFVAGEGYYPLFLHWNGSSWTQVESPDGGSSLLAFAPDHIYSAGGGLVHWDGQSWSMVETFDQVIGPAFQAIAAANLCDMFAVGRQLVVGNVMSFSARLQPGEIAAFTIAGDVTGNALVDVDDLLAVINAWGVCTSPCPADLNSNGVVDVDDLLLVINNWS